MEEPMHVLLEGLKGQNASILVAFARGFMDVKVVGEDNGLWEFEITGGPALRAGGKLRARAETVTAVYTAAPPPETTS